MPALRSGARRRIVVGLVVMLAFALRPPAASAASATFDVADQPVVQVIGRGAAITIRTWNRSTIEVDWPDGEPFEASRTQQEVRPTQRVPTLTVTEFRTATGPVSATLAPEDFLVPNITPGMHDVIRVRELSVEPGKPGATQLTVTIPAGTGLVIVHTGFGPTSISDYRGTTVATSGRGAIVLRNVGGAAFIQPLNGRFYAVDSDFDRLRIRSNAADEVFDACRVSQIEATTLTGAIVFDNGVFNPGLARFESDRGSIALGVNGDAVFGAHTEDGRVFTALPPNEAPPSPVFGGADADVSPHVGTGGPLVNASSNHGNVFLYDGSLLSRMPQTLASAWRPIYDLLVASRDALHVAPQRRFKFRR